MASGVTFDMVPFEMIDM